MPLSKMVYQAFDSYLNSDTYPTFYITTFRVFHIPVYYESRREPFIAFAVHVLWRRGNIAGPPGAITLSLDAFIFVLSSWFSKGNGTVSGKTMVMSELISLPWKERLGGEWGKTTEGQIAGDGILGSLDVIV
ncbi:hypothetical protein D9757_014190 [Collybiopsis confluens]|uniref:Uncharacterized protein n=1 Tax=Collybiopsis confluens TaxID=2823264 RepID=A0A8H5CL31_9AGAR|nr:hypothetical protein D9757_014190 [Collybiopsis confluens]